jgi:hypothetical protein
MKTFGKQRILCEPHGKSRHQTWARSPTMGRSPFDDQADAASATIRVGNSSSSAIAKLPLLFPGEQSRFRWRPAAYDAAWRKRRLATVIVTVCFPT